MPDTAPHVQKLEATIPAQATAGTLQDQTVGRAPYAGTVSRVAIVPEAAVTAHGTNFRTFRLVNKGQAGAGTTVVATFATDTVTTDDLVAFDEKEIPLSGTPANLVVAEGDILAADETVGAAGVAHSGYKMIVEVSRG